ncbi:MAG: hypothetical protein WCT45_00120 [Candidatus Paceibacterota bacterium]|jgi:hypothetical protein
MFAETPRYEDYIDEVRQRTGEERRKVLTVARTVDASRSWGNPDHGKVVPIGLRSGLAHDIRHADSLCELGALYKQLKITAAVPDAVLVRIIKKMFWFACMAQLAKAA